MQVDRVTMVDCVTSCFQNVVAFAGLILEKESAVIAIYLIHENWLGKYNLEKTYQQEQQSNLGSDLVQKVYFQKHSFSLSRGKVSAYLIIRRQAILTIQAENHQWVNFQFNIRPQDGKFFIGAEKKISQGDYGDFSSFFGYKSCSNWKLTIGRLKEVVSDSQDLAQETIKYSLDCLDSRTSCVTTYYFQLRQKPTFEKNKYHLNLLGSIDDCDYNNLALQLFYECKLDGTFKVACIIAKKDYNSADIDKSVNQIQIAEQMPIDMLGLNQDTNTRHFVSFPMLAYTNPDPLKTSINIVNLAVNAPQKRISIEPYKLIQFVETNGLIWHHGPFFVEVTMLVWSRFSKSYYLMSLYSEKWYEDLNTNRSAFNFKIKLGEPLVLPTGFMQLLKKEVLLLHRQLIGLKSKEDSNQNQLKSNKTKLDSNDIVALIVQFENVTESIQVILSSADKRQPQPLCLGDINKKLLPLNILSGPTGFCFLFATQDTIKQCYLIMLAQISDKLDCNNQVIIEQFILYKQSFKIIVWQLNHNVQIKRDGSYEQQIIILDEAFNFKILGLENKTKSQKQQAFTDSSIQLVCLQKIRFSSSGPLIKDLFLKIAEGCYNSIILAEKTIIVPYHFDEEGAVQHMKRVFNLKSHSSFQSVYLEFHQNKKFDKALTTVYKRVLSVQHLHLIGKHFQVVKEESMMYFETSQSIEQRRIDLVNQMQMALFGSKIKVLGGVILFQALSALKKQICLVFDTNSLMLVDLIQDHNGFLKTKIRTLPYDGSQLVEIFTRKQKEQELITTISLHRFYSNGYSVHISSEYFLQKSINNLLGNLDKQLSERNLDHLRVWSIENQNTAKTMRIILFKLSLEHDDLFTWELNSSLTLQNFMKLLGKSLLFCCPKNVANYTVSTSGKIVYSLVHGTFGEVRKYDRVEGAKKVKKLIANNKARIHVLMITQSEQSKVKNPQKNTESTLVTQSIIFSLYGNVFQELLLQEDVDYRKDQSAIQVEITTEYLIVLFSEIIFFIRIQDIKQFNKATSAVQQFLDEIPDIQEILYAPVQVDVIDLDDMFDQIQIREGVRIDAALLGQGLEWQNMIQITTETTILLWDIKEQRQYKTIQGYQQFQQSEDDFIEMNIVQMIPGCEKSGQQDLRKAKKFTFNSKKTLYSIPNVENATDRPKLFALFSALDAHELKSIRLTLENNQSVERFDPTCFTAQIFGVTIFQYFSDQPVLMKQIQEYIVSLDLQPYVDKYSNEYDNILIRQVFYQLQLRDKLTSLRQNNRALPSLFLSQKIQHQLVNSMCENFHKNLQIQIPLAEFIASVEAKLDLEKFQKFHQQKNVIQTLLDLQMQSLGEGDQKITQLQELIGLNQLSREPSLTDLVYDFDSFACLFQLIKSSASINQFIQRSLIETPMTEAIQTFVLDARLDFLVFGSETTQLSERQIIEQFKLEAYQRTQRWRYKLLNFLARINVVKPPQKILRQVKVQIVEIGWLNDNCKKLFQFLSSYYDPSIYKNELIKVLIIKQDYSTQIILKFTLPFLLYMLCSFIFQTYYVTGVYGQADDGLFGGQSWSIFMKLAIFILSTYFLMIEIIQIKFNGLNYFSDKQNWIQLATFISNPLILGIQMWSPDHNPLYLAYATSVLSFLMWLQVFYWMSLFRSMSFYVLMVYETMYDIRYFLLMFFTCVAAFANAVNIVDLAQQVASSANQDDLENEYSPIIDDATGNSSFDSIINQYLLGLGDFSLDNYSANGAKQLVWIYFVLATIITNIAFLNVLIAIVSDTYAKITESKHQYALQQRTDIFADFISMIKISSTMTENRFIYVMQPIEVEEENGDWTGSIDALKRIFRTNAVEVKESVENLKQKVDQLQTKLQTQHEESEEKLEKLQEQLTLNNQESDDKLEELRDNIRKLQSQFRLTSEQSLQMQRKILTLLESQPKVSANLEDKK